MFRLCLVAVWLGTALANTPLRFKDGKFKIAQFTDMHYGEDEFTPWGPIQDQHSDHVMHSVLGAESPDFVLFTGDVLTGNNIDSNATAYWDYVVTPCLMTSTPWAHLFGNHDDLSQTKGDRLTLMRYDMTYSLSHSSVGPTEIAGVSNYFLPIYGEHDDTVQAIIYVLDSGGGKIGPYLISENQVAWLLEKYMENMQVYGSVPTILTFHIPTPEFQDLYNTGECVGILQNPITPYENNGIFNILQLLPNLLLVTTGHYHENDYCCPHNNRLFCAGRHSGYGGYGTVDRGSRIIQFQQGQLQTWIRMEDKSVKDHMEIQYSEF